MKKFLKTLMLSVAVMMPFSAQALAASNTSQISITPFLREVRFSAEDGTKDFDVEIGNDSGKTQHIKLSVLDFGSLNETGGLVFAGSNASSLVKKYGLANWLQLSSSAVDIEAGKSIKIQASIIDDTSLAPGGHYAAIVASLEPTSGTGSNQISVNQKLSSLIFATKLGGEKYDLKLGNIDLTNGRFTLPGFVTLHFYNPGNVHVIPRGTVKILSPSGNVISQGVINEESGYVLPETSKQILVRLKTMAHKDLRTSVYNLQVDYRYDGLDKFARHEQPIYITSVIGLVVLIPLLGAIILVALKLRVPQQLYKKSAKYLRRK